MRRLLPVLLVAATACSDDPDATESADVAADASSDTAIDASPDAGFDASSDAIADVSGDASSDAGPDIVPDTDASIDTADVGEDSGENDASAAEPDRSPMGGEERPADVFVPRDYTAEQEWPLAILLHGYGASAFLQRGYLNVPPLVDELGFILITPDGLVDDRGSQFWNAFPECCDRSGTEVDDVGYLTGLIDEAEERYTIDRERIYFFGHSNGGFMSYRMACELGDRVAGIASLAGAMTSSTELCDDTGPVHVLQIHGTEDDSVAYSAAEPSAAFWADRNGCESPSALDDRDLIVRSGDDTEVLGWDCPDDAQVELWTIVNGGHLPAINQDFSRQMLSWLIERPRD